MAIFITGATGYLGAHVTAALLDRGKESFNLLVRARDERDAELRLWHALQLHLEFSRFHEFLKSRINIYCGDLTSPSFGLSESGYNRLVRSTDSIIHCAASLNRRSEKSCLNVNLRGTLEVIKLAKAGRDQHGLRRLSHVSTVAVAGKRSDELVGEDESIDWDRSDYDPYARTKKFSEHMINELLPDVSHIVFRPSIVLGDSRYAETTQFDMVRSFVFLAGLPALPFRPDDKIDIVNVDFVADAIATLHQKEQPNHAIYHLSSGAESQTFRQLTRALADSQKRGSPIFIPWLERPFTSGIEFLARRRNARLSYGASLLKVFMPYLTFNTVFDNRRAVTELGRSPVPFSTYCYPLLQFSRKGKFTYPYREWPAAVEEYVHEHESGA